MVSKKVEKYLAQYNERNYAPKERKIEKSDLRKHPYRSSRWQTPEASCGDSFQQSGTQPEEEIDGPSQNSPT